MSARPTPRRPRLRHPTTARRAKTISVSHVALAWYESEARRIRAETDAPMSAGRVMTRVLEGHARAATTPAP